jgi:putative acetyltransferase
VAEIENQPVGFITAIGTHIDLLFVSPDHGRQGIGGALIEALCAQYPAQILTVDASITANPVLRPMALRWWLSSGWRRAGVVY